MSNTLAEFKYLQKLFPADFVTALVKGNFLYALLCETGTKATLWRKHIDDCLELAYRYSLVDADLETRMKTDDWEFWQSAVNELIVAKYLESVSGRDSLHWHPQGRKRKVGEFKVVQDNAGPLFVEVKTIFPRELEALEGRIRLKLSRFAEQVPIPALLSLRILEVGKSENMSGKRFKTFLNKQLSAVRISENRKEPVQVENYKDDVTGLVLKVEILPISPDGLTHCRIGAIGGKARFSANDEYIKHSLRGAYEQRPSGTQPYLVILCSPIEIGIDEHDVLNALLGKLAFRVYLAKGAGVDLPPSEPFRKPNGFYNPQRNRRLSATGLYSEQWHGDCFEQRLEIYHNPFARYPLDESLFRSNSVRQLVKKNDEEMQWID